MDQHKCSNFRIQSFIMEEDAREFLVRVLNTISMASVWLIVNMVAGIYFELGIIHEKWTLLNVLFYLWFPASIVLLLWYFKKKWKGHLDH